LFIYYILKDAGDMIFVPAQMADINQV